MHSFVSVLLSLLALGLTALLVGGIVGLLAWCCDASGRRTRLQRHTRARQATSALSVTDRDDLSDCEPPA